MLRRETTYRLAGRRHRSDQQDAEGSMRLREIRLDPADPDAVARAAAALAAIPGLVVESRADEGVVVVRYSLATHSLQAIEQHLTESGFHLDSRLYARVVRGLAHFAEDTERHNMDAPHRLIKNADEVYVKAYEHHPHGDHDDTPPDLREDR